MINVHGLRRNMKNVVKNYSDAQIKVREATSNDPWGPSGTLMSEIADLTYNVVAFSEIMQVLWKRLNDHGKNWKHVYKALVLLEYLLKSGSERVAFQCKENVFAIETLKDFQHIEDNKDQGINVREKAKQLVSLLKDEERLKNERKRALKARERFALASARTQSEIIERDYGSKYEDRSSFHEDMLSPGAVFVSDLERVRPQSIGEEELQLQLALAMSKEEADQEERIKRNDELRLQMALSESREAYEKDQLEEIQNKKSQSAMEDLLDVFSVQGSQAAVSPAMDPWGDCAVSTHAASPTNSAVAGVEGNPNLNLISSSMPRSCYDFSSMKKSISVDTDVMSAAQEVSVPQKFLGENAKLVNFDALVETAPPASNPFPSLSNPFHPRAVQPSINEIRAQNAPVFSSASITLPRFHPPQFAAAQTDAALQGENSTINPFL